MPNNILVFESYNRMQQELNRQWQEEGIVYQIYPRSFQDTTGNTFEFELLPYQACFYTLR